MLIRTSSRRVDVPRDTWTYHGIRGRTTGYVDVPRDTWTYHGIRGRTTGYVGPGGGSCEILMLLRPPAAEEYY
ncbi:hypothetical protein NHX12_028566 [Muraenolepis orangiensis]|uniref:Uncharacterized protein n=1 Tax=Muraenolepis orangiensis TaxID=630683 RepID=A0A9Q0EAT9_9TELE|nr:hypothetical protein NHX12_028566 [Muraenolepis orangiensis]